MSFAGTTFEPKHDLLRLSTQFERVLTLMQDGRWRTLGEIARAVGGSEAGVSARLRDMRKAEFGGHTVLRQRRGEETRGLWEYRFVKAEQSKQLTLSLCIPNGTDGEFGAVEKEFKTEFDKLGGGICKWWK